jgi:hypothetical protein
MSRVPAVFIVLAFWAAPASAQISFEVIGARALGMGGAFVAVADDATAVHWNPAGLAGGEAVGMTVGWDKLRFGDPKRLAALGDSFDSNKMTSVATYPLGISYGHFHTAKVVGFGPNGEPVVDALRVHHIGVTVLQNLMEGVVVGTTVDASEWASPCFRPMA